MQTILIVDDDRAIAEALTGGLEQPGRDAMPGGGTLSISARRVDRSVQLVVADTGCGIPPQTLPFIFEPCFTTRRSGTGLGPAVAQQLVVRNGGTVGVESSGAGTHFDGTVVHEQIAAKWPRMGVIFSTGHADESQLPQPGLKNVGFLRKPYSTDVLLTMLREVV